MKGLREHMERLVDPHSVECEAPNERFRTTFDVLREK